MQIPPWIKLLWEYVLGTYGYALTTPDGSRNLLVGVAIVVATMTVLIWQRRWTFGLKSIASTSLLIPFSVLLTVYASRGFEGTPDPRCQAYNFGNQKYQLLSFPTVIATDPDSPFGEKDLLVLVRSTERWNGTAHTCILPMSDPKAQQFMNELNKLLAQATTSDGAVGGGLYFTFGSSIETPNVRLAIPSLIENKGPPDSPGQGT